MIGLPILLAVYGYFFFLEEGKLEGTSLEKGPQVVTDWCIEIWNRAVDEVKALAEAPEDEDLEVVNEEDLYAPGSAGQLGKAPKMYGMDHA